MKTYKTHYTEDAIKDLRFISDYIAENNRDTAIKFINSLRKKTKKIISHLPNSGVFFIENVRYLIFGNYIIAYKIYETKKEVRVFMIRSSYTRWKREMEKRM